jgi:hypothetical protein
MGRDEKRAVTVIPFIHFLKTVQSAHSSSNAVKGQISLIIRPGIALKGECGINRVHVIRLQVP